MSAEVIPTLLVDPLLVDEELAPGVYTARAQDPAYGGLEARVDEGRAVYLGERHDPDGTKYIAVEVPGAVGLTPNMGGAIRIGREFFTTALRDYHDWQEKWWREAIQNSVDAGATQIDCRVESVPEGFAVSVTDNGRGMDEDVLINKFLVLGGTTKTQGDTRGGFGKAKELLVLPWLAWSIHTRDRKVVGAGLDYQSDPATYRHGTEIRVVMPADQTTHESAAIAFISKCNLPGTRFTVNGQKYKADLEPGEELRSFEGKATLYYDKKGKVHGLYVRTMGLYMFEMWVSDSVKGTLVVELTGSSVELLTANRDGIRDYELKRGIERYVNELAADVSSALKKKQGLIRERFEGTGKFTGASERDLRSAMLNHLEELQPAEQTKRGLVLSDGQRSVLTEIVQQIGAGEGSASVPEEEEGKLNMRVNGEMATAMLDATVMPGPTAVEAAIKQLAWEPDFYLINEVEGFRVPRLFYPDGMTPGVKKLVRAWAEMCRFVLIQLGCATPYGVGLIFDRQTGAAYQGGGANRDEKGEHWLLLNPFRVTGQIGIEKPSKESLFSVTDENDVNWLYAAAVHECTHMADGITYHDESFSSAFTRNVAKCAGKDKQVRAIIKAIRARGPRAEGTASKPRSSEKARALPPLADVEKEASRVRRSRASGTQYSTFYSNGDYRDRGSDDLAELQAYASGYGSMEVRDQKGRVVWRTPGFSIPLAAGRAASPSLQEITDQWIREGREARATSSGEKYASFRNLSMSLYDGRPDLKSLKERSLEEQREDPTSFFEIREGATGKPVWRTENFGLDLQGHTPNRKSAAHLQAERQKADLARWGERDKVRGLREQIAALEREKKTLLSRVGTACKASRERAAIEAQRIRSEASNRCQARRFTVRAAIDAKEEPLREQIEETRHRASTYGKAASRAAGALRSAKRAEARGESDSEVERNIEPELIPIWLHVKRHIRGTDRMSRTEAFLHWVEENPDEIYAVLSEQSEKELRRLLREQPDVPF